MVQLKLKIADAPNTNNPVLITLRQKGYRLSLKLSESNDMDYGDWIAEKEGRMFIARDPLRLLALVAMWEQRGEEWQIRPGEENLYRSIVKDAGA